MGPAPDHVTGMDHEDSIPDPLPEWALSVIPRYKPYWTQFAALATKDGRKTGNAVVADFVTKTQQGKRYTYAKVVTDAGNILLLSENEIKELFYEPRWIMRNLLPAHVTALTKEEEMSNYGA